MRRLDLCTGLVTAVVGAAALADASGLAMFGDNHEPGAGFFPRILAGLLTVLGLLLAALALRAKPSEGAAADADADSSGKFRSAAVLVAFAVMAPTVEIIGFVPAMVLLVLIILYGIERRRDFRSALVAIVIPVAAFVLFAQVFAIPLPPGPLIPV